MEKNSIKSIVLIGAGNVATHLGKALAPLVKIEAIHSNSGWSALRLADQLKSNVLHDPFFCPTCDLVLVCTSDDAIADVISQLPVHLNVAYTSGSVPLLASGDRKNIGVFYPLQSFSKDREVDLSEVPFFIEATTTELEQKLVELAQKISKTVSCISSEERKKIHLAAIFANNFVNHLMYQAKDYLDQNQLDWKCLMPLLKETVLKLETISPREAQTGPARRNDVLIIEEHLKMLNTTQQEIYRLLSKSIQETYTTKE